MSIKGFIAGEPSSGSLNARLLILRILICLSLFLKHGVEKLTGHSTIVQRIPDPIHIGSHAGLSFAVFLPDKDA